MIIFINGMPFNIFSEDEPTPEPDDAKFYEREEIVLISFDGVYRLPTEAEIFDMNQRIFYD